MSQIQHIYRIEKTVEAKEFHSLVAANKPALELELKTPAKDCEKWFQLGIKKHAAFEAGMKQARRDAVDAAFAFLRARKAHDYGSWGEFLMLREQQISRTTVYFYISLAKHAMDWALRSTSPTPKSVDEVAAIARDMILHSPKPLIELYRELKLVRPFGEYDSVKNAARNSRISGSQIEFDFATVMAPLDVLCHFGDENYNFNYPEGVDTVQFMTEVETKLEAALARVRQIKQHGRVIET